MQSSRNVIIFGGSSLKLGDYRWFLVFKNKFHFRIRHKTIKTSNIQNNVLGDQSIFLGVMLCIQDVNNPMQLGVYKIHVHMYVYNVDIVCLLSDR